MGRQARITSQVRNGELEHVLLVGGKPFQSFTTLKAALCALALALSLSGCATLERHPIATAVVVGIVAGSIAASSSERGTAYAPGPEICRTQPEACR